MPDRTKITLGLLFGLLLLVFLGLSSYGFVEIIVPANGNLEATVSLKDQSSSLQPKKESFTKKVRKFVRRGSYEVVVQQDSKSYVEVIESGRFLGTTKVEAELSAEKSRRFIGHNPTGCTYLTEGVLISSACGDSIDRAKIHAPATSIKPTSLARPQTPFQGFIEGSVTTTEGVLILIEAPKLEDQGAPHSLYRLTPDGDTVEGMAMENLSEDQQYFMSSYSDGFLVYNSSSVFYYSSRAAQPVEVEIPKPSISTHKLTSISTSGKTMAFVFSDDALRLKSNVTDPGGVQAHADAVEREVEPSERSEVIINNPGQQKYSFDIHPDDIEICDQDKLCVLHDGSLEVYNITTSKQKLLFKLSGVNDMIVLGNSLLAVQEQGILRMDTNKRSGSMDYTFGDYTYCGIKTEQSVYTLCVESSTGKRSMLLIDPSQPAKDSIDKQIYELTEHQDVKEVSIYDRYVFVTPELGAREYQDSLQGFGYSPQRTTQAKTAINSEIDRLGIDRSNYSITITN